MKHEVIGDGKTVWVNSGEDGSCIARFSRNGIDIHLTALQQMQSGKQCLYCTHKRTGKKEWLIFQAEVFRIYAVKVHDRLKPKFVGES